MSKKISLRCRTPKGVVNLSNIDEEITVRQLKEEIENRSGIPSTKQKFKFGFPPKLYEGSDDSTLSAAQIKHGEMITVEESQEETGTVIDLEEDDSLPSRPKQKISVENYSNIPLRPQDVSSMVEGVCVRRVMASDNSCLFNAVAYCLEGSQSRKNNRAPGLRRVIADVVANDPVFYNEAYLGRKNSDYCKWILHKDSWGGAIELSILSQFYGIQITAFDICTCRKDVYGEGKYKNQIFLIYDGIHYDSLAFSPIEDGPEELDVTVFSVNDIGAVNKAMSLVKAAHERHEYTDVSNFKLRCMQCGAQLKGEREAQEHAKKTGHKNFAENK